MSVKRKWMSRITVSIITFSMLLTLVACGDTDDGSSANAEKITLTYSSWDPKYTEYELVERYEKENPNVDIILTDSAEWEGTDYLQMQAASDAMPDIINIESIDYALKNDWVIDLKPYIDADEEIAIPKNILDSCTFNGEIVMIPYGVFVHGVMLNKDLLRAQNVPIPDYDWTMDEFVNIAKKTTVPGKSIGANEVTSLIHHIPPQMNDALGYGAYNPATKHYDLTNEWVEGATLVKGLYDSKVSLFEQVDVLGIPWELEEGSQEATDSEAARAAKSTELVGEADPWSVWQKGKMAMFPTYSWDMNWQPWATAYSGFEWDYYPMPVMEAGDISRPGYGQDSRAITTSCENPDAAWDFLRYTAFSKEGFDARMDIYTNYSHDAAKEKYPDWVEAEIPLDGQLYDVCIPPTTNQETLDKYFEYAQVPAGVKFIAESLETGYPEGSKVVPGFVEGYGKVEADFKKQVLFGTASAADVAADYEKKVNEVADEAFEAIAKLEPE